MSQISAGTGFHYPFDLTGVYADLRQKAGDGKLAPDDIDRLVMQLTDRDRALEDFLASAVPIYDEVLVEESTTSTSPVNLATVGPTCRVKLPRGRCIITVSALVTCTVTNQSALVDLYLNGSFLQSGVILGNNSGGSLAVSMASTVMFTNLDPGTHTFQLKYWGSDGNSVRFDARSLMVVPVP